MLLEPIKVLSLDDMEQIHQGALTILENVGMKIECEQALEYLKDVGCIIDESTFIVKFPKKITQQFVDKMVRFSEKFKIAAGFLFERKPRRRANF